MLILFHPVKSRGCYFPKSDSTICVINTLDTWSFTDSMAEQFQIFGLPETE